MIDGAETDRRASRRTDPFVRLGRSVRPSRNECLRAILLAAISALCFLGPAIRTDRALVPFVPERYEPLRSEALAEGRITPVELQVGEPSGGDKYGQSLAWDQTIQERLRDGELPRWSDRIASGAPFVPQMAQPYQPWNLLLLLVDAPGHYGIWWLLHSIAFGFGAFWFLRRGGVSEGAAQFAVVLSVLGLWTQARVHHNVIVTAALSVWPLLTIVRAGCSRGRFQSHEIGLVAILLGSAWSTGFVPVALFTGYLVAAFALLLTLRRADSFGSVLRSLSGLALGSALGGVIALAQMVPVLVAASQSARASEVDPQWFLDHSLHWKHLLTAIWPEWLHPRAPDPLRIHFTTIEELPKPERFFNSTETAFAVGIPALLAMPMAFARPKFETWFFAAVLFVALGIAMAAPVFFELTSLMPGARTGDLRRFLFLAHIGSVVLAARGLDVLIRQPRRPLLVPWLGIGVLTWSLLRLFDATAPFSDLGGFIDVWAPRLAAIEDMRLPGETVDQATTRLRDGLTGAVANVEAERSAPWVVFGVPALIALGSTLASWFTTRRWLASSFVLLSAFQLWQAGSGTIVAVETERVMTPPRILRPAIEHQEASGPDGPGRLVRLESPLALTVPTLYPPNLGALHGLHDLSAYNPLPQGRMEELFLAIEPPSPSAIAEATVRRPTLEGSGVRGFFVPASIRHPILDLLGARFVLSADPRLRPGSDLRDRTPEGYPAPFRLFERTTTCPRVTFVDTVEVLADEPTRLETLGDPNRDPRRRAIVELGDPLRGDGETKFAASFLRDDPERIELDVEVSEPGLLRLADPWDEGWTVTVDGETRDLLVTDHYLRGVRLEPGRHRVVFSYDAWWVVWPPRISLLALLAAFFLVFVGLKRLRAPGRTAPSLLHTSR